VPEIGEDLPVDKNPLLDDNDLPEFNNFTIEKCIGVVGNQGFVIEKGIQNLESEITEKTEIKSLFDEVLNPLEELTSPIMTTWGVAKTLYLGNNIKMPSKSYMTIHERGRKVRSAKFHSEPVYYAAKRALNNPSETYNDSQKRLIKKYVLEGKLNGIELEGANKIRFNDCAERLSEHRTKFGQKVEAARQSFKMNCNDPKVIKEFPLSFLKTISVDQKAHPSKGPWKLQSLQPFIVRKFLEYCPDHNLRWNVWQADTRKCSTYHDKSVETSTHVEEIRFARREQAQLLGYNSFVDMSMETKMAGNIQVVKDTLLSLLDVAKNAQAIELAQLQQFAEKTGYPKKLEMQDIAYYRRRQLQEVYGFDGEVVKEFFPINKVIPNMFQLAEKLFNIKIVERSVIGWDEDVKYYDIFDLESGGKSPIAGFYVDLYAREDEKYLNPENTGFMIGIRNSHELMNSKPLAALIFNFEQIPEKPTLLTIEDVEKLFNKFGHSLQHLLCKSMYSELAGSSNIEWDAVEVCGNVMTNLLYNEQVLKTISSHYSNDEPLREKHINAILNQRQSLAGYNLSREIYYSMLDIELHSSKDFWQEIVKRLYPQHHVLPMDKKDMHVCSFDPIFSGEWGGAYFSHIWSQLIGADVYSAFFEATNNENDFLDVGKRFRNTFLLHGGSLHPSEVFRRFRGRDPSEKALLRSLGLKAAGKSKSSGDEK
jgi:oligopeptidase A